MSLIGDISSPSFSTPSIGSNVQDSSPIENGGAALAPATSVASPSPASINTEDRVDLSSEARGTSGSESSGAPDLTRMFDGGSDLNSSGSSTHADSNAETGEFSAGAEAHTRSGHDRSETNGNVETTDKESREAKAGVEVSGSLLEGKASASGEASASLNVEQGKRVSQEGSLGPISTRSEAGAGVSVDAHAGISGGAEIDLSKGSVDAQGEAGVGVEVGAGVDASHETEAFGVKHRAEGAAGVRVGGKAEASGEIHSDRESIAAAGGAEAKAELVADAEAKGTLSSDLGSVSSSGRVEASASAEAHAKGHFESTPDTLSFGGDVGASAAAQLAAEGTLSGETANGSAFELNGGVNTGSIGFGVKGGFDRRDGKTSIALGLGGDAAIVGGQMGAGVTIADKDVAEASVAHLRAGSAITGGMGHLAESAGQVTENVRQGANSNQDFLNGMSEIDTGNSLANFGIDAVQGAHGAYTGAVNLADNAVDATAAVYNGASSLLNGQANHQSAQVENGLGIAGRIVTQGVNNHYQAGRRALGSAAVSAAVGTGQMINSVDQGLRSFGSFLNPFD